ncbi:hypothetical protein HN51_063477 [Arachis hypogaea]
MPTTRHQNTNKPYTQYVMQLHGVDDNIDKSKKILTAISRRMSRNKWILGSFMAAIVLAIILITFD